MAIIHESGPGGKGGRSTRALAVSSLIDISGFSAIDLGCGLVAYRLDVREKHFPALLLLAQRFVYRQLMYSVVIRAVIAAAHGAGASWGKLERSGRVNAPALVEEDRVEAARVAAELDAEVSADTRPG